MGWFLVFVVITIWNLIHIWPDERWAAYWFYAAIVLPILLGTVTSVWFTIGGVRDLRTLFQRLRVLHRDIHDDGTVFHDRVSAENGVALREDIAVAALDQK